MRVHLSALGLQVMGQHPALLQGVQSVLSVFLALPASCSGCLLPLTRKPGYHLARHLQLSLRMARSSDLKHLVQNSRL